MLPTSERSGGDMASALAVYLRAELDRRGWNARQLADRAGMPPSGLSKILNRVTEVPDLETLDKLAVALDVPLVRLVAVCGFRVGDDAKTPDEQIAILLEVAPEFRDVVDDLTQLQPDDLRAIRGYVDALLRRS
jgi:transcriptional regulator with XRE-family HTH domain